MLNNLKDDEVEKEIENKWELVEERGVKKRKKKKNPRHRTK